MALCGAWLPQSAAAATDAYGPVARSETLWSVARKVTEQQGGGNVSQMAWALYQANPGAFDGAPGRIRLGASLDIPDAAAVKATTPARAFALLNGTAPAVTVAASPAAAPARTGPVITQVELQPQAAGEPLRWLIVAGSGFAAGAQLELRDLQSGAELTAATPQSVRTGRIEYAAAFPEQPSRWQVVVRNPDGRRSAPAAFEFGAAAGVASAAAAAAPPADTGVFEGSADQRALRDLAQARASAEQRYQLLAPLEAKYSGDVDFDYPLGVAALDTGRLSEAVFVLQRAVATRPAFSGARMELARAYYAIGDNESARREFTTLQQENPPPPPEARRAIAQYLDAIDHRAVSYEPQRGVFAEIASGYDSNANGAPDIQNFIGFNLDSRNQATASGYYGLGLGGSLSHPLAPAWRAVGSGLAAYRGNPDASFVDSQVVRLGGGLEWRPDRWVISLVPSGTYAMLDGQENHQVLAADAVSAWGGDDGQLAVNVRFAQQRYTEALEIQDIDTVMYGLSTQSRLAVLPRLQFGAAVTAGTDEPVNAGSPFGRDLRGVRVSTLVDLGRGSVLMFSIADLDSDFDGLFFGEARSDEQLSAALGFESGVWRDTGWKLRLQANYVDNASTVALYDYDRIDAGLALRKEFK